MAKPPRPPKERRPYNEAIRLYEMNVEEVFHVAHHVLVDSSLGLVPEDNVPARRRPRARRG